MVLDAQQWQETFAGAFRGDVDFSVPMSAKTYLGIGGAADVVAAPSDPVSLRNLIVVLGNRHLPFCTVGSGTNILVRDGGIEGVVISLRAFDRIEDISTDDGVELFVEAGVPLQRLVSLCREKGYSGIEGMAGIPGTVGGAICGNAGSYGREMKDVLVSVVVIDAAARLDRHAAADLGFGYRRSDILPSDVVVSANIRLQREDPAAVAERTGAFLAEKKRTQPIAERSAGCVFKNPPGESAGRLIDEAGCKGMRVGGIEVSVVHANFFVNRGGGTAADYLHLMEEVCAVVRRSSGISLEPEIRVVGRA